MGCRLEYTESQRDKGSCWLGNISHRYRFAGYRLECTENYTSAGRQAAGWNIQEIRWMLVAD